MSALLKAVPQSRDRCTPRAVQRRSLQPGEALAGRDHRSRLQRFQSAHSVCDRTELFDQGRAFFPIVDYERVVFSKSGPRSARHFTKIHEPPVGHIGWS
jgi:hypothetical protein